MDVQPGRSKFRNNNVHIEWMEMVDGEWWMEMMDGDGDGG